MPTTLVPRKREPGRFEIIAAAICVFACAVNILLAGLVPSLASAVALFSIN